MAYLESETKNPGRVERKMLKVYTRRMKKYPKGQAREIIATKWIRGERDLLLECDARRGKSVSAYLRGLVFEDAADLKISEK